MEEGGTTGGVKKTEKRNECPRVFLRGRCLFDCEAKEAPEPSQAGWSSDSSLTSRGPEVNTENDLLSPAQLKTKRRGHLTDVFFFWGVNQFVAEVTRNDGGGHFR